jgi:hypothetical protein
MCEEQPLDSNRLEHRGASGVALALSSDSGLLGAIKDSLESPGLQVVVPESAADLPTRAKARQPVLILLDADLAEAASSDGTSVLEARDRHAPSANGGRATTRFVPQGR